MKWLRIVRILVSLLCFATLTGWLVDYGMTFPEMSEWLAKIQLLPAALAFSLSIFIIWMLATLIFGRIYCSTICPLGFFQDIAGRLGHNTIKRPYLYHTPVQGLRYIILAVVVIAAMIGLIAVAIFLDPYGLYARFCVAVLKPLNGWIINATGLASPPLVIATAAFTGALMSTLIILAIGVVAWRRGRLFCNTICPVGTTLGIISRFSIFHIDINTDKCIQCRKCEHVCKSECIDPISHTVDGSRCVNCFDCVNVCSNKAIRYTYQRHQLAFPLLMKTPQLTGCQTADTNLTQCTQNSENEHEAIP